ncbi:MAG: ornithine carbamoyltransferase [Candidatus Nanopelagicaceae bacterium]
MKDLLRTEHLSRGDIDTILTTAREFASNPLKAHHTLAGKSVAIYMTKPSTRTRLASETAVAHLGGHPIFLRSDDLQLGRGETIADTARVISGFADAMIIRTFKQSDVDELGRYATIPVINGLTDEDHPTQLLADWTTIFEHFGSDIAGRKFAYFGDGNNMANSWLIMGAIMGAHVVVATPQGRFAPDTNAVKKAQEIATTSGARIEVVHDAKEAASGASVLYTDVWMSMGDPESDRSEKMQALTPFKVDDSLMKLAASDAVFMHCLPAHREEEVSTTVIDGERSLIWRQAFHRRTTIQAILFHLLRGDLKGRQ